MSSSIGSNLSIKTYSQYTLCFQSSNLAGGRLELIQSCEADKGPVDIIHEKYRIRKYYSTFLDIKGTMYIGTNNSFIRLNNILLKKSAWVKIYQYFRVKFRKNK